MGNSLPQLKMPRRDLPGTVRIYPICCTSMYCGKGSESCPTCRCYPTLQEFLEWVRINNATVTDPIWSPLAYTAQSVATES